MPEGIMRNAPQTTVMLAALTLCTTAYATAQDEARTADEEAVIEVVVQLFDGMRAGDSAVVRQTLAPQARLVATSTRDGESVLRTVDLDRFVAAIGEPRDEVWDERLWDVEVRIDQNLATVWTEYAFYIGDKLSHCGVDAFQLFRSSEGWTIFQIADTRRGADTCDFPG
jgi:hypothetical protein